MKSLKQFIIESSDSTKFAKGDKLKIVNRNNSKFGKTVYVQQVQPKGNKMKQHSYLVSLDEFGKKDQWSVGESELSFA